MSRGSYPNITLSRSQPAEMTAATTLVAAPPGSAMPPHDPADRGFRVQHLLPLSHWQVSEANGNKPAQLTLWGAEEAA